MSWSYRYFNTPALLKVIVAAGDLNMYTQSNEQKLEY